MFMISIMALRYVPTLKLIVMGRLSLRLLRVFKVQINKKNWDVREWMAYMVNYDRSLRITRAQWAFILKSWWNTHCLATMIVKYIHWDINLGTFPKRLVHFRMLEMIRISGNERTHDHRIYESVSVHRS